MDGNTDEKTVQDNFIGTLMEMMKGGNIPVYQMEEEDKHVEQDVIQQYLEDQVIPTAKTITGPAVPHQNGYIPNNQGQNLRYDVRNMYAQMGSYPQNDSVL